MTHGDAASSVLIRPELIAHPAYHLGLEQLAPCPAVFPADRAVEFRRLRGLEGVRGTAQVEEKLGSGDRTSERFGRQLGRSTHQEFGDGRPGGVAFLLDLGQPALEQADIGAEVGNLVFGVGVVQLAQGTQVPPQR